MNYTNLAQAIRLKSDEVQQQKDSDPYDTFELLRVLARLLEGKTVYRSFGAPGDWGYSNPIGKALSESYKTNSAEERLEHDESALREIVMLCGMGDPSNGEGTSPTEVVAMVRDRLKPQWTQELPTEQGTYWHWNGDTDALPLPVYVMYSGHSRSFFLSAGQYGWTEAQDVEDVRGWWMLLIEPQFPKP